MAVSTSAYRLTDSVMAVVYKDARKALKCLDAGSIVIPTSAADSAGMVQATCEDVLVAIFRRDLEERSIEITPADSSSSAKANSQSKRLSPPLEWKLAKRSK